MGDDAQQRCPEGESIDNPQSRLGDNDGVDQPRQEALGEDGVLLDELGQVVEARGDGQGKEAEADESPGVADERENPHLESLGVRQ